MGNGVKITQLGFDDVDRLAVIDQQTIESIQQTYSIEDEMKLIRKYIASTGYKDKDFLAWNDLVNGEVAKGKDKKSKLSKKVSPVAKDHDGSKFKPVYPDAPINQYEKKRREGKF
jgi:hypothetical protein